MTSAHAPTTISVITPSLNQGGFIAETIESVLRQSGDFEIDYFLVDGGSTDQTVEIIRHYEELLASGQWPVQCRGITLRWVSEPDRGQTDAIMKGFATARGEILGWLNSDDTYFPGALQAVADQFREHPEAALIYGDADYCDAQGNRLARYRTQPFSLDKLAYANIICQPSAFFRREAFAAVGGLDRSLHFAMDFDLWIKLARRFPCRYLPQTLSSYRLHEASKTIRPETLFENSEEALRLTLKHYGWAPLTRVYNSCNFFCQSRLPGFLTRRKAVLVAATLVCSVLRSLWLNRGFCPKDIVLFNQDNFRKLFKSRLAIMTGREK